MSTSNDLCTRIHDELNKVKIIDTHEHLERDRDAAAGPDAHLGRFFLHYAKCDLVSAGMDPADMVRVVEGRDLSDDERWAMVKPWYERAWNTAYCEALRIAWRDLYGVDDLTDETVGDLLAAMRAEVGLGWTRKVFDRAGIEFALLNPFGPRLIHNSDCDPDCFIVDMIDNFTDFPLDQLAAQEGRDIRTLDDYLDVIDACFERYAPLASALKVGRAYTRSLTWNRVARCDAEPIFNRLRSWSDAPGTAERRVLEDYVMHHLVRRCGECGLTMKFHTGIQEGNGNFIRNSRAALMANLFMEYPKTRFDIYHISYPYQEELVTLAKNFRNVFIDFAWMWVINPAAGRRALSDMLDAVPANKIHGFGGDYIFPEGSYGHCVMARREIARVLCEKVEEGRFTEDYAARVGRMLLRENAMETFGLEERRRRSMPAQREACAAAGG